LKEKVYDPILQFWNGEQKKIFDRILAFMKENQANFDHVEAEEKLLLAEIVNSPKPYENSAMKDAKEAMDTLAGRIEEKINEERAALMEEANNKIAQLKLNYIFKDAPQNIQEHAIRPFEEIIAKASQQHYIGNLKSDRNSLSELYTRQLNYLAAYKTGLEGVSDHPLPPLVRYTSITKSGERSQALQIATRESGRCGYLYFQTEESHRGQDQR